MFTCSQKVALHRLPQTESCSCEVFRMLQHKRSEMLEDFKMEEEECTLGHTLAEHAHSSGQEATVDILDKNIVLTVLV